MAELLPGNSVRLRGPRRAAAVMLSCLR